MGSSCSKPNMSNLLELLQNMNCQCWNKCRRIAPNHWKPQGNCSMVGGHFIEEYKRVNQHCVDGTVTVANNCPFTREHFTPEKDPSCLDDARRNISADKVAASKGCCNTIFLQQTNWFLFQFEAFFFFFSIAIPHWYLVFLIDLLL